MHLWQWLGRHDRDYAALRRAARAAIVMPGMFALGDKVIGNADVATFGAFGAFAMLLLVDFSGPLVQRLQAQVALVLVGAILICIATAASANPWIGAIAMAVVGFGVLFAGVVSSTLATASTAMLLAFILPVSVPAPVSAVPGRLAGWGLAGVCGLIAVAVLWPAPPRDRLRPAAITACEALAARIRAEVAFVLSDGHEEFAADRDRAAERAQDAIGALQRTFLATPYRPGGLRTSARTVTRLVAELGWLNLMTKKSGYVVPPAPHAGASRPVCAMKVAAAAVLERGAELLTLTGGDGLELQEAMSDLSEALAKLEDHAAAELPGGRQAGGGEPANRTAGAPGTRPGDDLSKLVSALDPAFRAQEIAYGVTMIGRTIALTAAAERRTWMQRMLGRQPEGLPGSLSAAESRAAAHVQPHSVWLRNSIRAAAGLGLAVLVARLTGVQHSFWVVLGTLSVLRSNALSTGQDSLRALAGTVVGLVVGAGILQGIGTNEVALWVLLPFAVLLAGIAPAAISFAAGQAAFTLTLVILFNLIRPAGWQVGLLRLEDIALGCGVSIVVGLLFWPRGASAVLRQALADAYADSAAYLAGAVEFGIVRCTSQGARPAPPAGQAARAAAADRRLDDAFRAYLAEHGPKPVPLADMTRLVTGASGVRLAAGAVLDLWRGDPGKATTDRSAARGEILHSLSRIREWYDVLAASLTDGQRPRDPLAYDQAADGRLIEAVRSDLDSGDSEAAATAVRIVWTGDHLDATRRLQEAIAPAAQMASRLQGASRLAAARTLWSSHGRPIS
ncbi:MAG: FUSC family protein [Streptosporangiaceae bacterium]